MRRIRFAFVSTKGNPPFSCQCKPNFSSLSPSISVPSHDHIVRLILDQKTASEALQTFQWASKLPNFSHSQSTYSALIRKLCAFRRFDTVEQLLDEMPSLIGSPPDEAIFVTFIRGLGRAGMIREVIKVLDLVLKFEKKPSTKVFNSILDVLVKEDIDLAREFYRRKMMASGVQVDEYTYGILMKGLCLTNRIGDGFKLLQIMTTRGITPNTVIYNTLIHALCKNEKVGRARSLMSEMKEPNDVTFNILISAYCDENKLVQALVLLEKSFNMGFVPDVIAVTKLLEVLCNQDRVSEALEILGRVESKGGKIDVLACNTLIKDYCRHGKVRVAVRFLKDMERKGCLPNADTYNALISGFCDCRLLDSALHAFNDMKRDGIRWNFTTFDTLIRGLCAGGRVEDGLEILDLMHDTHKSSRSRINPYNSILYGFYKDNRWEEAIKFLSKMEKLFPRAVNRSFKILDFCKEGSIKNAKSVYDQMVGEGGFPSVLIYDCLIQQYCQEGYMQEAFEIMNDMVGHDYFPGVPTFNALISGFCKEGKLESGLQLMEDMVERRCIPDTGSYAPLLEGFCKTRDFQNAWELFSEMMEKGINPNSSIWGSLLLCLIQDNLWQGGEDAQIDLNNRLQQIIET